MKRILTVLCLILYLVFYLALVGVAAWDNLAQGYPQWRIALDLVVSGGAAICILLYIIRYRPKTLGILWKLFPIVLIMYELFSWHHALFVDVPPGFPPGSSPRKMSQWR